MAKKLLLTQKKAIRLCKKQWKLVLEGKAADKQEAWWMSGNPYSCMLCEYALQFMNGCESCPLMKQHGITCLAYGTHYERNPKEFAALVMKLK